jgi:antitoxin VapB
MATAKLFMNGRSQAVRLPREFRFRGREVRIRREGDAVVLEPMKRTSWPHGYWETLPVLDDAFELPADPVPPPLAPTRARSRTSR